MFIPGKPPINLFNVSIGRCCYFLMLFFFFQKLYAQEAENDNTENNYQAAQWNINNGLSEPTVTFFLKDINGFLWISTSYGLNRFDGSTFKNYFSDKNSNKTIIGNRISRLVEDSLHNIWIGTDQGISRYDIKADTFTHFLSNPNTAIIPFYANANYVYCIEGASEITAFNTHSFRKKVLMKFGPEDIVSYGMAALYTLFDIKTNSVWLLEGNSGVLRGGLSQACLSEGKRKHYEWQCYKKIKNHDHTAEGMVIDRKRNCIWINSNDGLLQFTLGDKKFHYIEALNRLNILEDYVKTFRDWHWVGIDVDAKGKVWIATIQKGIVIYDPARETVAVPFPNAPFYQKEVSNANTVIYCDRDNIVWTGFWWKKGIFQLNPFSVASPVQHVTAPHYKIDSLSKYEVINCINGDSGQIWMGTKKGLSIFHTLTNKFERVTEQDLHIDQSNYLIPFVVSPSAKKAWISNEGTLYEMNLVSRKCRRVMYKDKTGHDLKNVYWPYAVRYRDGCIVQAQYNNQTALFILKADSIKAHQILAFPTDEIVTNNVITDGHFLFLLNKRTNTTLTYAERNGQWIRISTGLDSVERTTLFSDPKDRTYWLVTNNGLIHYSHLFKVISTYPLNEIYGNKIVNLLSDNSGNLWFNTDRSIYTLRINSGKIVALTERDGFESQNFMPTRTPAEKDAFGNLYFAGGFVFGEGFNKISPDRFRGNYPPSTVYVQSIKINEGRLISTTGVNNLRNLELKYFQNSITIETGILDYYSKGKSTMRYLLEDVNKTWQYSPAYYTIRYDHLPHGNYKLLMQASNAAGDFTGPVKTLLILISPPFWSTWWFRTITILSTVALIFAVVRHTVRHKFQLQLQQSEREKEMATLQQQKAELQMETMQAKINEMQKMQKVRSQIAADLHDDIGSTLTSISYFSEIAKLQVKENETAKTFLDKIGNSSRNMISSMNDIVWMINPEKDTTTDLLLRMKNHASEMLVQRNITCSFQVNEEAEQVKLNMQERKNFYLIYKEALHNAVKYADCNKIEIGFLQCGHHINLIVKDDGKGFNVKEFDKGNGLQNMQKRTEEIKGKFEIKSDKNGTCVKVACTITRIGDMSCQQF